VQARARDLVASLEDVPSIERLGIDRSQVEQIVSAWETQLATLDERFEALETQLDTAFAKFEERLPEPAANVLGQAHDIAKTARKQVRELLRVA
jgi:anti-sigma-K factor RskA